MLEQEIKAYKECLLHVLDGHTQSENGVGYDILLAERAIERIPLDSQAVWPRTDVIEASESQGLWTNSRSAAAVTVRDDSGSHVYVLMAQPAGGYLVVDVSPIEQALFSKLGTAGRSEYERYETEPDKWLSEAEDYFLLSVQLRAWREGQRYSVSGPVLVKHDGIVVWQ